MNGLKLFVVGENSSNPADWEEGLSWCLVFAKSPDEAKVLAGDWPHGSGVSEVIPV